MTYCDRCERYFPHERALEQHKEDSGNHHICNLCNLDFGEVLLLKRHWVISPKHNYCQKCNAHFTHDGDLMDHCETMHICCRLCRRFYDSALELHEHNRQSHHYCPDCRRLFTSESNLRSHLRSRVHTNTTHLCPGRDCGRKFISMAALILHFESGTCPSRITREQFNRAIAQYDKHHIITNPARMITHGEGDEGRSVVTVATERAWNGSAYECCICRREFRSLQAIDQHLASPAHAQKQFFCPRDFAECGAEFKAASALCQHIEREQCGVRRFRRQIEAHIECLTSSMKRLGF